MSRPTDLVQGTLDLLILKTIALEPSHGWGIAQRIQQISRDELKVQQGWIRADWGASDNGRRARFYSLTAAGRRQLQRELAEWDRLSAAIGLVIQET